MPSFKSPAPLRDEAMTVLGSFFNDFYYKCRTEGSLDKLRQGIAFLKTELGPRMPRNLAVVFHKTLLTRCSSLSDYPSPFDNSFLRMVAEVAMDEKLTGLRCTSEMLALLNPEDFRRIQGSCIVLNKLAGPYGVEKLNLQILTKFEYRKFCTDLDLVIIGHHCRKLTHIDVSDSSKVTDAGLRALGLCSDLRSVSVAYCCGVSETGLKNLLTVNVRLTEVFGWDDCDDPGFDYFRGPDWTSDISVHPSIESFTIARDEICDRYTRFLVAKFPNLTWIKLDGELTGDVCILNSLKRLSKIDFGGHVQTSDKIESLLKCFGAQIEHIVIEVTQSLDLNLIFAHCKNLEYLRFNALDRADPRVTLVVPPFQKLKSLICVGCEEEEIQKLEFGQMLKLEKLEINGFTMNRSELKSMILDHTNFPSLKIMEIAFFGEKNDFDYLSQLVQSCNLDFELRHVEAYYC